MGHLAASFGPASLDEATLEPALARIVATARAAWPDVVLDDAIFVAHLADHVRGEADLAGALVEVHAADLFVACAAARGEPRAAEAVRGMLIARMPAWLSSLRLDEARLDEATQAILAHVLVPRPNGTPRVADYAGRGPLGGWLRIASVRTALDLREAEHSEERPIDEAPERMLGPPGGDVELDVIRQLHREDFAAAFRAALDALDDRDRALLGLYWLDGVPTTRLATMYGAHRTSIARWIEEAQQRLLASTRALFAQRLDVPPEEAESLIRLLHSRLDVSLRVLRNRG